MLSSGKVVAPTNPSVSAFPLTRERFVSPDVIRPSKRRNLGTFTPSNEMLTQPVVQGSNLGYSVQIIVFNIDENTDDYGYGPVTKHTGSAIIVGSTDPTGINNHKKGGDFKMSLSDTGSAIDCEITVTKKVKLAVPKGNKKNEYLAVYGEDGKMLVKNIKFLPGLGPNRVSGQKLGLTDTEPVMIFNATIMPKADKSAKKDKTEKAADKAAKKEKGPAIPLYDATYENNEADPSLQAHQKAAPPVNNKPSSSKEKDLGNLPPVINAQTTSPDNVAEEMVYLNFNLQNLKLYPAVYADAASRTAEVYDLLQKALMESCVTGNMINTDYLQNLVEMKGSTLIRIGGEQISPPQPVDLTSSEVVFYPGQFVDHIKVKEAADEIEVGDADNKEKIPSFVYQLATTFVSPQEDPESKRVGFSKTIFRIVFLPPSPWEFDWLHRCLGIPYEDENLVRTWLMNMRDLDCVARCSPPENSYELGIEVHEDGHTPINICQMRINDIFVNQDSVHDWSFRLTKSQLANFMEEDLYKKTWEPAKKTRYRSVADLNIMKTKHVDPVFLYNNVCCINELTSANVSNPKTFSDGEGLLFGILPPVYLAKRALASYGKGELAALVSEFPELSSLEITIMVVGMWNEYIEVLANEKSKQENQAPVAAPTTTKTKGKKDTTAAAASNKNETLDEKSIKHFIYKFSQRLKKELEEAEPIPSFLLFVYRMPESEESGDDHIVTYIQRANVPAFIDNKGSLYPKILEDEENAATDDAKNDQKDDATITDAEKEQVVSE